ncbi:MAG TPA: XRE family transcriptional regulator [Hyphomicrobium sp.]|nr:XRE family transcriptional regulator [Hyphomicrobium sp.]
MVQKDEPQDRERTYAVERSPAGEAALSTVIGARVRNLRARHRYSLERLANLAGVSRAMLSQIENGQSVPTIVLLNKVAEALDVPLVTLVAAPNVRQTTVLKRSTGKVIASASGKFQLRPLFPSENELRAQFYEAVIAPQHCEELEARASGTKETYVVVRGRIELTVGHDAPLLLEEGDAAFLEEVDRPRTLRNPETHDAIVHFVIDRLGAPVR